jgi:hypothetical protein
MAGSILIVEPVGSGRWILSDGSDTPISEHETANAATRAAQLRMSDVDVTEILLRDRYGRCRWLTPPGRGEAEHN